MESGAPCRNAFSLDDDPNSKRFARSIHVSVHEKEIFSMLRAKVGLFDEQPEDEKLITDLLDWMQQTDSDYTNTFKDLTNEVLQGERYDSDTFKEWHARYMRRGKYATTGSLIGFDACQ